MSHLLKKSLMENFIFCAMLYIIFCLFELYLLSETEIIYIILIVMGFIEETFLIIQNRIF